MPEIKVNRLTNSNVYLNGKSLLGRAEEVNLPEVKAKMAGHKALGMDFDVELRSGTDKMECSIKWNAFYGDVLKKVADPTQALKIQVRGNLETYTGAGRTDQKAVIAFLTVIPKSFPGGNFKQHDNVEATSQFNVVYYKLRVAGEDVLEVDVFNNIHKVAGVDILAKMRANIGA